MWIELRPSTIHGTGGFATREIPAGTPIVEYVGELITKEESLRQCQLNNQFIFYFNDQFDLNGNIDSNPARFFNHSCEPNAEATLITGRIWIVAARLIHAGEEITFDYGYDLESYRNYPCACGTPGCIGYIIGAEYRERLRDILNAAMRPRVYSKNRAEAAFRE